MIDEIDILHESHRGDFARHAGEKSAWLFCVISYHHQRVVELGKNRFYPFSELFVCPCRRFPIFLIQSIGNFKSDVCYIKKILLYFGAEIAFVTEHRAVMIFPLHIIEVMEVVDACRRHVVGMDYATYSADCMEFISIIIHSLRCAIAPIGCHIRIVATHRTAFRSCIVLPDFRQGVKLQ